MSFINVILSAIYLWLRPLIKWALRRTTQLCELQRICYGDEKGSQCTSNVEFSLANTRTNDLKKTCHFLDIKAKDQALTEDSIYYAVYTIVRLKKISTKAHKRFPEMLGSCMSEIWTYKQLVSCLNDLRRLAYDSSNSAHEEKLLQLWSHLLPNEPLKARVGKHWQDIGFQGNDPATDFRGMGILGLQTLLYFAENHSTAAQHVLSRSQHPVYGYSFAIVGINIAHLSFSLVEDGTAKTHFYNSSKTWFDVSSFYQFFCCLFFEFDVLWRQERPKDIMEFSRVRGLFETSIRDKLKDYKTYFTCKFVLDNI